MSIEEFEELKERTTEIAIGQLRKELRRNLYEILEKNNPKFDNISKSR